MKSNLLIIALALSMVVSAQVDTSYFYLKANEVVTTKDSALYIRKVFREGAVWRQLDFWVSGELSNAGSYLDEQRKIKTGTWTWYSKKGILTGKNIYQNNVRTEQYLYHEDGSQYMHAFFENDQLTSVTGWDENGAEIPDFIYQQEASFPGGMRAWQFYLRSSLERNLPKDYRKGKISGATVVAFKISKEGKVTDVTVARSSGHPKLDEHALNIFRNSPDWMPAVQYNRKVIFYQRQSISFPKATE